MSNQSKKSKKRLKKLNKSLLRKSEVLHSELLTSSNDKSHLNSLRLEQSTANQTVSISAIDPTITRPDYKQLILNFSGEIEEWGELILKTHNEFGYGFEYEDLEHELIEIIKIEVPGTSKLLNDNQQTVEAAVVELKKNHTSKLIDMLEVTDAQNGAYWRGELDEYLTYG